MIRECTRAMARRHVRKKAEELVRVDAGVQWWLAQVNVKAWVKWQMWRRGGALEEAHRHKAKSPHAIRMGTRAACPSSHQHIPT
jgi:hypothetical protein